MEYVIIVAIIVAGVAWAIYRDHKDEKRPQGDRPNFGKRPGQDKLK